MAVPFPHLNSVVLLPRNVISLTTLLTFFMRKKKKKENSLFSLSYMYFLRPVFGVTLAKELF